MFFTTGKSKIAYQDALDKDQKEHEKEKQGFSNEVSAQLAELRDGILNSAQAYQKAIEVIGGHIGSTENFNNLLIEQTSKEKNITEESNSVIEKEEITEGKNKCTLIFKHNKRIRLKYPTYTLVPITHPRARDPIWYPVFCLKKNIQ